MNVFDWLNSLIINAEYSFINLVATVTPWLAPAVPAWLSYIHAGPDGALGLPEPLALIIGIEVEALGLTTVSTLFSLWRHNQTHRKKADKLPLWIPASTFVFYLAVVLTVNVLLQATGTGGETSNWVIILAMSLLTLLSIPAVVIVAIRNARTTVLKGENLPGSYGKLESNVNSQSSHSNLPRIRYTSLTSQMKRDIRYMNSGAEVSTYMLSKGYLLSRKSGRVFINRVNEELS